MSCPRQLVALAARMQIVVFGKSCTAGLLPIVSPLVIRRTLCQRCILLTGHGPLSAYYSAYYNEGGFLWHGTSKSPSATICLLKSGVLCSSSVCRQRSNVCMGMCLSTIKH